MSALTCAEVESRLDLYAAGEADAATRAAVERHLARCPACARACAEARQLAGLLHLHFRTEDALRHLHARIEAEESGPARLRRVLQMPLVRRAAALAALLLLSLGLLLGVGPGLRPPPGSADPLSLALVSPEPRHLEHVAVRANPPAPAAAKSEPLRYRLDLHGQTPTAFRRHLLAARGTDRLPPPPAIDLSLELRNRGPSPLLVRLGGEDSSLVLEMEGPGVLVVPGRDPAFLPLRVPKTIVLASGKRFAVRINRLAFRAGGEVRYLYWTAPGRYLLTARLRAVASRDGGATYFPLTVTSRPVPVEVRAGP